MDLYAVLGVRADATPAELRAQYRKLVREYHPDVAVDKLGAHERLVQIVNAYRTLSDDERRADYDRSRRAARKAHAAAAARPPYSWQEELRKQSLDALMVTAELFFIRDQKQQAILLVRRILQQDPSCGAAYGVLGDFLRDTGQRDEALQCYTMAAQLTPHRLLYERKIDRLLKNAPAEDEVIVRPRFAAATPAVGVGCLGSAGIPIGLLLAMPERANLWIDNTPAVMLVGAGIVSAFLVGCGMAVLRWLAHADEEVFAVAFDTPGGMMPIGVWLLVSSLLSVYLAAAAYLIIVVMEEQVSWSVVKVFAATAAVLGVFAVLLPGAASKIAFWGGNAVFPAMLAGWSVGSMGRSRW